MQRHTQSMESCDLKKGQKDAQSRMPLHRAIVSPMWQISDKGQRDAMRGVDLSFMHFGSAQLLFKLLFKARF